METVRETSEFCESGYTPRHGDSWDSVFYWQESGKNHRPGDVQDSGAKARKTLTNSRKVKESLGFQQTEGVGLPHHEPV